VSFRLLGPVASLEGDTPVDLGGAKRVALLAALLIRANRVCSTDHLIDVLWGDDPPAAARATLQSHVAHLRRHLGASLRSEAGGYVLEVPVDSIDAHRFEELLDAARAGISAGAHAQALADAEEALSLWHGSALEGLSDRPFAGPAAARLEELRLDAVEIRLEALAGLGRHAAVAADAEHALAAEPWRERLWELLALALYRDGRQAAALAALRRARTQLLDQLGVDPSPGLLELETRILNQDTGLISPEPAAAGRGAASLPVPLTSFIGRLPERQGIADAVKEFRLVTVLGRGGVGKTRLAIAVAGDVSAWFPDGVWFVDLVPVSDPSRVAAAVATRLGVSEREGLPVDEALLETLRDRRALIVLDNCEHVIAGIPPVVERVLAGCAGVSVLATSRSRLLVPFERVVVVEGLDVDEEGDAVALFEARALSGGALLPEDARARIAGVCQALDGTPLAIELAAARVSALGVDGLEAGLADQLRVLSGRRGATDRHSSVRAALDWSWALLDESEKALFRRVSIFVAPFGADAAAAVSGGAISDVAEQLARLSEESLLVSAHAETSTRYRMLETLRQYGEEKLVAAGEVDAVRGAHAAWYLDRAADLVERGGSCSATEFGWLADNLRASLRRAGTGGGRAYNLALTLGNLLFAHGGLSEAQDRFEQAAAAAESGVSAAVALRDASGVAFCRIHGEDVVRLRREAARADGNAPERSAYDLASAAMVIARHTGVFAQRPPTEVLLDLLALVDGFGIDTPLVRSLVAAVKAFRAAETGVGDLESATLAVRLAEGADPVTESLALDALFTALICAGDVAGATESVRRRTKLLTGLPRNPSTAPELIDGLHMAAETSLASGDLAGARSWALQFRDLPFMVEQEHVTTNRLMVIDALAGEWDEVLTGSERYRAAWEREDRPRGVILARGAAAVAMVHGMLGHEDAFARWRSVAASHGLVVDPAAGFDRAWPAVFDGVRLLHLERHEEAVERLSAHPAELTNALGATWRGWYAALWAEAAVLAGRPDASSRLETASSIAVGNAVAELLVRRAEALLTGDDAGIVATVEPLAETGCRYQSERSAALAGALTLRT
jgi:predicted ATPase/DNA-binding SARP family transcriptional activator